MNLQLTGYVAAMSNHRVDGDKQMVGNLLVGHALYQSHYDVFLAVAQLLIALRCLVDHIGYFNTHITLFQLSFLVAHGRNEDFLLYLRMLVEPFLVIIYVVKCGAKLIVVQSVRRQILDDDILQLFQFQVYLHVMLRERLDIEVGWCCTVDKRLHVREDGFSSYFI